MPIEFDAVGPFSAYKAGSINIDVATMTGQWGESKITVQIDTGLGPMSWDLTPDVRFLDPLSSMMSFWNMVNPHLFR